MLKSPHTTLVQVAKHPPVAEDNIMLTIAILSLVLIPVAVDLAVRRHRQTITLSLVRPR